MAACVLRFPLPQHRERAGGQRGAARAPLPGAPVHAQLRPGGRRDLAQRHDLGVPRAAGASVR